MNQAAATYTRASSDRQKEDHIIASQSAALLEYAKSSGYMVPLVSERTGLIAKRR
jgi:site-specific DNA recombinase